MEEDQLLWKYEMKCNNQHSHQENPRQNILNKRNTNHIYEIGFAAITAPRWGNIKNKRHLNSVLTQQMSEWK